MTSQPTSPDRRQARNAQLRADFATLQKKHLMPTYIVDELSKKYFLAPSTVYAIAFGTGRYRQPATSGQANA